MPPRASRYRRWAGSILFGLLFAAAGGVYLFFQYRANLPVELQALIDPDAPVRELRHVRFMANGKLMFDEHYGKTEAAVRAELGEPVTDEAGLVRLREHIPSAVPDRPI